MKALMIASKKRGSVMHANVGISTGRARSETDPRIQSIEQRHWGRRRGISDGRRISSRRDGRSQRVLVEYIDPSARRNAEPHYQRALLFLLDRRDEMAAVEQLRDAKPA